jgi:cell division protein FtsW (lipid II flippase)
MLVAPLNRGKQKAEEVGRFHVYTLLFLSGYVFAAAIACGHQILDSSAFETALAAGSLQAFILRLRPHH